MGHDAGPQPPRGDVKLAQSQREEEDADGRRPRANVQQGEKNKQATFEANEPTVTGIKSMGAFPNATKLSRKLYP